MTTLPLNRDQQISVMTSARNRRATTLERWSQDDEIQQMLRQTVGRTDVANLEETK